MRYASCSATSVTVLLGAAVASLVSHSPSATADAGDAPRKYVEVVRLRYIRDAAALQTMVENANVADVQLQVVNGDRLLVGGASRDAVRTARQLIAQVDLPQPQVRLDLWGIQISGGRANGVARAAQWIRVRAEETRYEIRRALAVLRRHASALECDPVAESKLTGPSGAEGQLGYSTALDPHRPLSVFDVLLRLVYAEDPEGSLKRLAGQLQELTGGYGWLEPEQRKRSFERLLTVLGGEYDVRAQEWEAPYAVDVAKQARVAILGFAEEYREMVMGPESFSPYYLERTRDVLDAQVKSALQALYDDVQRLYMEPLLKDIRHKAPEPTRGGVSLVGNTSITCLDGFPARVTGKAISYFDITPPPALDTEALDRAAEIEQALGGFLGAEGTAAGAATGALPATKLVSLLLALGEKPQLWSELASGITLEFTPHVNSSGDTAELELYVKVGTEAPHVKDGKQAGQLDPVSRIETHEVGSGGDQEGDAAAGKVSRVHTRVTTLDILTLSTFAVQTSHPKPDFVFPILGRIPYLGEIFRCPRAPSRKHHESMILVNATIIPSAMDLGRLYPIK